MSIRLNKAISELNIGLQTAVDFLKKRSELGNAPEGPNSKLTDEQYKALVEAYKSDKEERTQAEKLLQKKPKEKKRIEKKTERQQQKYTPLGKIDLDSIGKKPSAQSAASASKPEGNKAKASAVSQPEKEDKAAAPQQKTTVPQQPSKPTAATPKAEPQSKAAESKHEQKNDKQHTAHDTHITQTGKPKEQQTQQTATVVSQDTKVFTLKSEKKLTPKVNVLGKIDLDALNQSTRPKKKTKEERRKEREEKAQQNHNGNGERKKRQRINKERVDIAAAAKQQSGNQQGGQKNAGGSNKKKNRKRGGQKPAEVSEEDVARQVKETLARLTSKGQNKKGAKYR